MHYYLACPLNFALKMVALTLSKYFKTPFSNSTTSQKCRADHLLLQDIGFLLDHADFHSSKLQMESITWFKITVIPPNSRVSLFANFPIREKKFVTIPLNSRGKISNSRFFRLYFNKIYQNSLHLSLISKILQIHNLIFLSL